LSKPGALHVSRQFRRRCRPPDPRRFHTQPDPGERHAAAQLLLRRARRRFPARAEQSGGQRLGRVRPAQPLPLSVDRNRLCRRADDRRAGRTRSLTLSFPPPFYGRGKVRSPRPLAITDLIFKQRNTFSYPSPACGGGKPRAFASGGWGHLHNHPTRLAEFIIGRRFAPTRWLATLPFQGRDKKSGQASSPVFFAAPGTPAFAPPELRLASRQPRRLPAEALREGGRATSPLFFSGAGYAVVPAFALRASADRPFFPLGKAEGNGAPSGAPVFSRAAFPRGNAGASRRSIAAFLLRRRAALSVPDT